MNSRCLLATLALLLFCLEGCSTIRHGGAPTPAFNEEDDLKSLEEKYKESASIDAFYKAGQTAAARNAFIDGRLALYDMQYSIFVRDLSVDKQHLDAGTDLLLLGLAIAGTSTGAIRAKTNLAAAAAAVTGSKITVDKYFYFEKTVPALITTMDAERKQILAEIIRGTNLSIEDYSFRQARQDLDSYNKAGSLIGAITIVQADASVKDKAATEALRQLKAATPEQITASRAISTQFALLVKDPAANLDKINKILKVLDPSRVDSTPAQATDAADQLRAANKARQPGEEAKWRAAFASAGITIP